MILKEAATFKLYFQFTGKFSQKRGNSTFFGNVLLITILN